MEDKQQVSDYYVEQGYHVQYHRHRALNTGETNRLMHDIKHGKVNAMFVEMPRRGKHVVEKNYEACILRPAWPGTQVSRSSSLAGTVSTRMITSSTRW